MSHLAMAHRVSTHGQFTGDVVMSLERTKLTPPEVARQWGVSVDKVLTWIRSGELRAVNLATRLSGRPRYRIDINDLRDFEQRRAVVAPPTPSRTRKKPNSDVIQFF